MKNSCHRVSIGQLLSLDRGLDIKKNSLFKGSKGIIHPYLIEFTPLGSL